MIILNGATQSLSAVMSTAATTTNPTYSISYVDVNLTALVQGNTTFGSLNGTTPVNMLTGNSDQLSIKSVSIFNVDTVQQTITVNKTVSSSNYGMVKYTLNPGDSIHYDEGNGWKVTAFNSAASIVGASFITTGTTYTTPANISSTTQFKFTLIGGGGGGGGLNTAAGAATGGGGGAVCILYTTGLSASTAYTIAIGSGGAGGANTPAAGSPGGNTTLTIGATTYTAGGGGGGAASDTGVGGSAGTATNGTINISGAQGNYGGATTTAAGGGGHAAMLWGAGGSGLEAAGNGNPATGYGGGGGGGRGATATGGNGSGGAILVEYEN